METVYQLNYQYTFKFHFVYNRYGQEISFSWRKNMVNFLDNHMVGKMAINFTTDLSVVSTLGG